MRSRADALAAVGTLVARLAEAIHLVESISTGESTGPVGMKQVAVETVSASGSIRRAVEAVGSRVTFLALSICSKESCIAPQRTGCIWLEKVRGQAGGAVRERASALGAVGSRVARKTGPILA